MKKIFIITSIVVVLIISFAMYKIMDQKVEYEVLNFGELPEQVQNEIARDSESNGFSLHDDEKYTYIFYRANHTEYEYITTGLSVHKKNGTYIITSLVDWAADDSKISYEKAIKFEKVSKDDMILEEQDRR
ncbi:hypothetical protein OIN60_13755 [Paenibacillus sp. P96]|uniref:DUF3139 domain-containing protein n=1 Tax=Paenibacillus zeirhizosphaerae TaxID=2987519 RepID=A0ABT9FSW5_9BACL|nr:hypothetical protein [Paenibacillus sp. P96]MDP4097836.1 hypothetical protein [Paenibacillus sp. P96]